MTPLMLEILLHYYSSTIDYRDGNWSAPAVRDAMQQFEQEGWLAVNSEVAPDQAYVRTDKLVMFIDHVCALPAPVQKWVMP